MDFVRYDGSIIRWTNYYVLYVFPSVFSYLTFIDFIQNYILIVFCRNNIINGSAWASLNSVNKVIICSLEG